MPQTQRLHRHRGVGGRFTNSSHKRRRMVAKKKSVCAKSLVCVASSPELNLAENAQRYLRQLVVNDHITGDVPWRGSVKKKMQIVREKVIWLNEQKEYWRHRFSSLKPRAQHVIDTNGELLKSWTVRRVLHVLCSVFRPIWFWYCVVWNVPFPFLLCLRCQNISFLRTITRNQTTRFL